MRDTKAKIIVIVALMVAIVAMSIGFAAFSNTLNISSQVGITPDSNNFNVVFSNRNDRIDTSAVIASTKVPSTLATTQGEIDNSISPTLSNLNATFTAPGQKAVYTLYVYNAGEYEAKLNSVSFLSNKYCFAREGATESLVTAACDSITMSIKIGDSTYTETTRNITGHNLAAKGAEPVTITIEYLDNGAYVDGPFDISFSDISLYYSTVSGKNEEYVSTFTGVIYRHSNEVIANGNSLTRWCGVVPGTASTCVHNEYIDATFNSKEECESSIEYMASDPNLDSTMQYLLSNAVCQQETLTYETNSSNLNNRVYLKHEVVNDTVTASYVCARILLFGPEFCLKAGDSGASYGSYTGMSSNSVSNVSNLNPTGNIATIQEICNYYLAEDSLNSYEPYCQFSESSAMFEYRKGTVHYDAYNNGFASMYINELTGTCQISDYGSHC